ncbi:MAG: hypothetical protein R3213_02205 [Flavobacteriaceae bacterium]|nr:hypothetical protein [Flavobacteriaceae bacterium]
MRLFLLLLLSYSILSCSDQANSDGYTAYFGGEIDNPQGSFVYIKDSNGKYDTIPLNSENRFMYKINDLVPGLYEFGHGGEIQVVVLEPQDSLAFRLNTRDFDESLAFTGKGAKKNNYLMRLFLEHENNRDKLLKLFRKEPEDFQSSLDSIMQTELAELKKFSDDRNHSDLFRSISKSIVEYNYYYYKEIYPFGYYGYRPCKIRRDLNCL